MKRIDENTIINNVTIGLQRTSDSNIVKKPTQFNGIEQYLYVRLDEEKSFKLTEDVVNTIGIPVADLWDKARENTFAGTVVCSMGEILGFASSDPLFSDPLILVVTNESGFRGASAILDPNIADHIRRYMPEAKRVYMLPSSVHEVLIVGEDTDARFLTETVRNVNGAEVDAEDQLGDCAYLFNLE